MNWKGDAQKFENLHKKDNNAGGKHLLYLNIEVNIELNIESIDQREKLFLYVNESSNTDAGQETVFTMVVCDELKKKEW